MAGINGKALAAVAAGSIFVYAGLKGVSVTHAMAIIISGKNPKGLVQSNPIGTPTASASSSGTPSGGGGDIAGIASGYVGRLQYVFGGPPPSGTVDCSSFASKVLNEAGIHDPGGLPFDANSHGPSTISYLSWQGAATVGHSPSDAQRNDLCVWQTHMGIATGNGEMVSARDPAEGVGVDTIAGDVPGELLFVRRIKTLAQGGQIGF